MENETEEAGYEKKDNRKEMDGVVIGAVFGIWHNEAGKCFRGSQ